MADLGPIHGIVMRTIDRIAPRVAKRAGLDKQRWLRMLMRYMAIFDPVAHGAIVSVAVSRMYADLIEEYIRKSKTPAVENLTDLERIKRALKRGNRIIQLRNDAGEYVAKRLRDCTPVELDTLAEQYERSATSDLRRARFCRLLAHQMRLAGFQDDAPLSRLIGA